MPSPHSRNEWTDQNEGVCLMSTHQSDYLPTYLPTCLPTYLPTYLDGLVVALHDPEPTALLLHLALRPDGFITIHAQEEVRGAPATTGTPFRPSYDSANLACLNPLSGSTHL